MRGRVREGGRWSNGVRRDEGVGRRERKKNGGLMGDK